MIEYVASIVASKNYMRTISVIRGETWVIKAESICTFNTSGLKARRYPSR